MDNNVNAALEAAIKGFQKGLKANGGSLKADAGKFYQELKDVFELPLDFMSKVEMMDKLVTAYPEFSEIREVVFDLLLVNFFSDDVKRLNENYLDSKEWEAIEEDTLERGTELLNIFLYLRECEEEEIEPSLEDYLKEFLLIEDDEFQDELEIYEPVISHQVLMESSVEEIARISKSISPTAELKELFYPIMVFFYEINPSEKDLETAIRLSENKPFDSAVLFAIIAYSKQ